jgi:hypothetical protein
LQWSKQAASFNQLLFRFWQDVKIFGTGQESAIPDVIGLDASFGIERIRDFRCHQGQAGTFDLTKAFFTCGGAVDDCIDGQLQAAGFEFYVDDAVASFDIGNDSGRVVNDILSAFGEGGQESFDCSWIFFDDFG